MKYIVLAILATIVAIQSGCVGMGAMIYHDQKKAGLIGGGCANGQCVAP